MCQFRRWTGAWGRCIANWLSRSLTGTRLRANISRSELTVLMLLICFACVGSNFISLWQTRCPPTNHLRAPYKHQFSSELHCYSNFTFYSVPVAVPEYCDQAVCLSSCVCLSSSISLEPLHNLNKILCAISCGHGSVLLWWRCAMCTFGLWMTSRLATVGAMSFFYYIWRDNKTYEGW